ncbi:MAG: protoporphyrinogen oxidase [Thermoleophilia bacterium]|nr:protoporphyrinogen oxidase [Thermoleophilia bacterium]
MRVAIIGGGVSGLGAAWALRHGHEVELLEADDRLGGHANTRDVAEDGRVLAVDTGFIVHNERTYPELLALFAELDVPTRTTEMSLSVECRECGLQYAGRRPWSLVVGALRRPRLLVLLRDIGRFMRRARRDLERGIDDDVTLAEWAAGIGASELLVSHFLLPLAASVWSAPPGQALEMPAGAILAFLDNHGMLSTRRLEWRTVCGGSREYVVRMRRELERCGVRLRTGAGVAAVRREGDGVQLTLRDGSRERFDAVVLAVHADHALGLLADADPLERELLSTWTYTPNHAQLHDDASVLPTQRSARASWNYRMSHCSGDDAAPVVTYLMNRLQGLEAEGSWCVTLNGADHVDPARVGYETAYRHPQLDAATLRAQRRMPELDAQAGRTRTVACGAWRGYGFHEDGLRSGLEAGRLLATALMADTVTPTVAP